ncbi:tetratricopeptide repeat protein [Kineothrix sp. MB12-C1]|uniref:tetratricopeptide repeat protein n=1 Tax=Kineothrix sp. MB12-C1 TaxID=3070215 RepID=UPI0027D22228|nr:tetratricopeptide repeat protein [Kineothrix sp. MB12-C1]WMC91304.1 tetratricopeptide repeat protein [Kineothrix sp. MB12-C1]
MGDLRNQAKKYKEEGKYQNAIEIYEKIWTKENTDKWAGWEYAYCLKKVKEITKAIMVCKYTYKLDNNFVLNNDLMAWCVYEKYFQEKKETLAHHEIIKLDKIAKAAIGLIEQKQGSAYEHIVFAIIHIYKNKGDRISFEKIVDWLGRLKIDLLSDEAVKYIDKKGNDSEWQSRKEEYFSYYSKALIVLERYNECIECCELAEKKLKTYHYDNDIWIKARLYYSQGMLEEYNKALLGLTELSLKKNHWSIIFKIAQLYDKKGEGEQALLYVFKALLSRDPDRMKVKVVYFAAEILEKMEDYDLAKLHYIYFKKIREDNEWEVPLELDKKIEECKGTCETSQITSKYMRNIWIKRIKGNSQVYKGVVSKIMKNGKNGFILYNKNSIFFRLVEVVGRVKERDNVTFIIEDSFDKLKNKRTKEAKYIEIV